MSSTRRALALSFTTQYLAMAVQFATTIVISRLLVPEEVGVYSVAAAFVALGQILRDFGTGQYIIQEQDLTNERIQAAFSVTLLLGFSLALIMLQIAPIAGNFYDNPGIEKIIKLLAFNFALLPFGTITAAYLRRSMNFLPMAISRVGSASMRAIVTISCAFSGLSYMSLAWGGIAQTVTTILIMLYFRPAELPKMPGLRGIRRVLSFGGKMSVIEILEHTSASIPDLVIGKTLGMHSVGIFSRSVGTIRLFRQLVMQGAYPVINPYFAEMKRGGNKIREPYLKALSYIMGVSWPIFGFLFIIAEELTLALFGPNWLEIVPLVKTLCIIHILSSFTSLAEQIFTSTGNINLLVKFSLQMHPIRIVSIGASAFISLQAVIMTMTFFPILRFLLLRRGLSKVTGIEIRDYIQLAITSGTVLATTTLTSYFAVNFLDELQIDNPYVIIPIVIFFAALSWLATILTINHPIKRELQHVAKLFFRGQRK